MKKLLILALLLSSCTWSGQASTSVHCPCVVKGIGQISDDTYKVYIESINKHQYIEFYSTYKYNLGDTIR